MKEQDSFRGPGTAEALRFDPDHSKLLSGAGLAVMVAQTTRRTPIWFSIAFLMLAFSIFSWGLGYKLSLYNASPSTFHRVPSAKLLSGDEQNTGDQTILSGDLSGLPLAHGGFVLFLMLPFAALALVCPAIRQWEMETAVLSLNRRRSAFNSFFFRPPPHLHA